MYPEEKLIQTTIKKHDRIIVHRNKKLNGITFNKIYAN